MTVVVSGRFIPRFGKWGQMSTGNTTRSTRSGGLSALGQKQTCAAQNVMSALPPKADMCSALVNVRFVPIANIRLRFPHHCRSGLATYLYLAILTTTFSHTGHSNVHLS